jgi:hypothetical protein
MLKLLKAKSVALVRKGARGDVAVSYLPILPPAWAALPSDQNLYPRPAPVRTTPSQLRLDSTLSCPCTTGQTFHDARSSHVERTCTIYSLTEPFKARIQVQKCQACPPARHWFIGPNLRESGIFNYNNSLLFTHELLDEYTCSFTTSETPFVAWASVVSRCYALGGHDFVSDAMLRSAWFAYVQIQQFDNDLFCTRCGPSPEDVIWDGVTLAFGRKHVLETLKPPTATEDSSPVHAKRKYVHNQQILADQKLRELVWKAAIMPTLPELLKGGDNETDLGDRHTSLQGEENTEAEEKKQAAAAAARVKAATAALDHIGKVTLAGKMLTALNKGLGALFVVSYGVDAYQHQRQPSSSCRRFFQQVCRFFWNPRLN